MTRAENYIVLFFIAVTAMFRPAMGQPSLIQPHFARPMATPGPAKGVPLTHLYFHFLLLQNFLDTKAASLDALGQDGNFVRADLQKKIGFSDAEYAPIHESARRFAWELNPLEGQVKDINDAIAHNGRCRASPSGLLHRRMQI